MGNVVIHTACAEVPDEEAHRVLRAGELAVGPDAPPLAGHGTLVCPGGIGVRHHEIGLDGLPRLQPHPRDTAVVAENFLNVGVVSNRAALALEQAHEARHNGPGAAHGRVHAELPLEREDEAVDLRDPQRVAPNEQWVKAEDLLQLLALKVPPGHAEDAAPGPHLHHGGHG